MGRVPDQRGDGSKLSQKSAGSFSRWLDEMQIAMKEKTLGANVPCGSCTACCRSSQFIHVRPEEIATLKRIPAALLFPAPGAPVGHVLMGYNAKGECPMLIADKCSIYDDRPQTCRDYDCRIFPATGFTLDDADQAAINEAAAQWTFEISNDDERRNYASVRAAAQFFKEHRDLFPVGFLPTHPARLASLAIQVHTVFLDRTRDHTDADTVVAVTSLLARPT